MPGRRAYAIAIAGLILAVSLVANCSLPATESPQMPALSPTETYTRTPPPSVPSVPTNTIPATAVSMPSTSIPSTPPREGETVTLNIVFDNNPLDPRLRTGWGFAAWVEYGGRIVLFDTGADGSVLLGNMAVLGLDPQAVESVVLSHNHADHTGGLEAILSANPRVTVYVPQAFPAKIKDQARATGARVVEVGGALEILPGLWSTGQMGTHPVEQALVARTAQGLVVVTGCAHPGVDRVVARAKEIGLDEVLLVVGGFHLGGASQQRIQSIVDELRWLGVEQVAPSHCTGGAARKLFRREYGEDYYAAGVGWWWQSEPPQWTPSSQGIPAQVGVAAVAVAPSDARMVYLAACEPGGLYHSTDGGGTWQAAGAGLEQLVPLSVVVHPADPNVAWAGTMAGGYRTSDGGQNWDPMLDLPQRPIYTLAVASDGHSLYAGGEASGIWRSNDDGHTWLAGVLADGQVSVLSLAITADGTVYAGTAGQGLWVSNDGGVGWQGTGWDLDSANVPILTTASDGRFYALADGHLYLSLDGGDSWETVGPPDFEGLSFAAGPDPSGWLYMGGKGRGLRVSPDGGRSWLVWGDEWRHADITCLVAGPSNPGVVYLGTRNNGLYQTTDGGKSWTLASRAVGQPLVAALAQDPVDPGTFYAGTLDGVYQSVDGGENWQLTSGAAGKVAVQALAVSSTGDRIYAGARTGIYLSEDRGRTWRWLEEEIGLISVFHVVIDPHKEDRIYAGSWGHNVLRSTDGGRSWAPIHHGLETLSVHAFAVDPTDPQVLYAGTVEAVYRSTDGGQSWEACPLNDRPLTIFALAVDPADPGLLYAGTTEGVYRSTDDGQTWEAVGAQSLCATVTALALDPTNFQTLYAGTEHHGLNRSTDGRARWQPWGLDGRSVYDILIDRSGKIWLGTDRGIFRQAEEMPAR